MAQTTIGGYSTEMFVNKPFDSFLCGICLDILKNPHQCKNGHVYCLSCITLALRNASKCPFCSVQLYVKTLSTSLALKNLIDEIMVVKKCPNVDCEWSGILSHYHHHVQVCAENVMDCVFHKFNQCAVPGCSGKMKRRENENFATHRGVNLNSWVEQRKMIDVQDKGKVWYEGIVLQVTNAGIKVHFRAWSAKFDEFIPTEQIASRIESLHTKTKNRLKWKVGDYIDLRVNNVNERGMFVDAYIKEIDFDQNTMKVAYSEYKKQKLTRSHMSVHDVAHLPALSTYSREYDVIQELDIYSEEASPEYTHTKRT